MTEPFSGSTRQAFWLPAVEGQSTVLAHEESAQ